jgi:hypothetical protein
MEASSQDVDSDPEVDSVSRGYSDAAGQAGLLARIDRREELDLSNRNLAYTAGLAGTYVALTRLDISNNSVSKLDSLPETLVHLDASKNMLKRICGLEKNEALASLDLSSNSISRIGGLDACTALTELSLSGNQIRVATDLECNVLLERLDLSRNAIATVDALRTLSLNQCMAWLELKGNPCAANSNYRHKLTSLLPQLLVLDAVKMPKNNFRPASPSARPQSPRPDPDSRPTAARSLDLSSSLSTTNRSVVSLRPASAAALRSSAGRTNPAGPLRAFGDGGSGRAERIGAATGHEGRLGPWAAASTPQETPGTRLFGAASASGDDPNRSGYASRHRAPSPAPGGARPLSRGRAPAGGPGPGADATAGGEVLQGAAAAARSQGGEERAGNRRGAAKPLPGEGERLARLVAGVPSGGADAPVTAGQVLASLSPAKDKRRAGGGGKPAVAAGRPAAAKASSESKGDQSRPGAPAPKGSVPRRRAAAGEAAPPRTALELELSERVARLYQVQMTQMDVVSQQQVRPASGSGMKLPARRRPLPAAAARRGRGGRRGRARQELISELRRELTILKSPPVPIIPPTAPPYCSLTSAISSPGRLSRSSPPASETPTAPTTQPTRRPTKCAPPGASASPERTTAPAVLTCRLPLYH